MKLAFIYLLICLTVPTLVLAEGKKVKKLSIGKSGSSTVVFHTFSARVVR